MKDETTNAIILAAGRGSRMKEKCMDRPKCMVELGGKTLLDWQIEALTSAGITTVHLVTGYKSESLPLTYYHHYSNPIWDETNMLYSLCCAEEQLCAGRNIICYSDIVYHPDHIRALQNSSDEIAITYDLEWDKLWSLRFSNPLDDAETFAIDDDFYLTKIGGRTCAKKEIQGQYMGLLSISQQGWKVIKEILNEIPQERKKKLDMTTTLQLLLTKNVKVKAIPVRGKWAEMDNLEDFELYSKRLESQETWIHDWRW